MSLLDRLKGVSRDTLIYGAGDAVGKLTGVLVAPILTRIFLPADYGVMALIQTAIGLLVMIAGLNLTSAVFFYYYDKEDPGEKRVIISMSVYFCLGVGALLTAVTWFAAPAIGDLLLLRVEPLPEDSGYDYVHYLRILGVGIAFQMVDSNTRAILRMLRKPLPFVLLNLVQMLLNVGFVLLLVVGWDWGLEGAFWAQVLSSVATCLLGLVFIIRRLTLAFSFPLFVLLLGYCLPALPSVLFNWGLVQGNRFFLNYFSSLSEQGEFAIALKVTGVFVMLVLGFRLAWDPFALSIMKQPDSRETYARVYSLFVVGMAVAGAVLALFARPILMILTPEPYWVAYVLVPIMIWAYLNAGGNNILGLGIAISKRTKFYSYAQIVSVSVNVGLNLLLVPRYHAFGAALAYAGGTVAQGFAYYVFAQRLHPIPYRFFRLQAFGAVAFAIAGVQAVLVWDADLVTSLLLAAAFSPPLLLLGWWWLGREDRDLLRDAVSRIRAWLRRIRARDDEGSASAE